jgi:hypothetical protein
MAKKTDEQGEMDMGQEVTLSLKDLATLVASMNQAGTLDATAIAEIAAKATASATAVMQNLDDGGRNYPGISCFNPLGEKAHPRPDLLGDIYWAGYLLRGDELTREEIELTNQLTPGDWEIRSRSGTTLPFKVRDLDPGSRTSRRLLVLFPCATADQRHDVPTMVQMLSEVVGVPVPA